ncbi:MAG TPA: glycosyltransferase family 2 protein [Planctomycetota bacterium]|nr:glycosyltransferase family 2 protein [Planctomycetota bacterium]
MAPRLPLTVLITTYNEARNLPDCLASVAGLADDVLVVDSFSSDATVAIAEAAGARVERHEYLDPATQKNWALPRCLNDWVLILDADERVTPQLSDELRGLFAAGAPVAAAHALPRRTFFFGTEIRRCGWDRDVVVRLIDRTRCRYGATEVHEQMVVDGATATLHGKLDHYTYRTFDDYLDKFGRYTTWSANDLWRRGKRCNWSHLTVRPLTRFVKMYLLKRGFLDGIPGLMVCALAAIGVFVRYAKLWAMQRARDRDDRWHDGRPVIHAGAAILDQREIISGGHAA